MDAFAYQHIRHKLIQLIEFPGQIADATKHRFDNLMELFDSALYTYIRKHKYPRSIFKIQLKILGEDAATSKPWIFVLCDKELSKRMRKFFKQAWVEKEYQPIEADDTRPSLQVKVYEKAPRPLGKYSVWMQDDLENKYALLRVGNGENKQTASLGGMIRVTMPGGSFCFFGMTVGHLNLGEEHLRSTLDIEAERCLPSACDEDSSDSSDEEESDIDYSPIVQLLVPETSESSQPSDPARESASSGLVLSDRAVGLVAHTSSALDWALVHFDSLSGLSPPPMLSEHLFTGDAIADFPRDIIIFPQANHELGADKLEDFTGTIRSSSYCMLPLGRSLTKVFDMSITSPGKLLVILPNWADSLNIEPLRSGDSGLWVRDLLRQEVYGHVVCLDAFGEASVVLMTTSFHAIKQYFGASDLSIAQGADWIGATQLPSRPISYQICLACQRSDDKCDSKRPSCTACDNFSRACLYPFPATTDTFTTSGKSIESMEVKTGYTMQRLVGTSSKSSPILQETGHSLQRLTETAARSWSTSQETNSSIDGIAPGSNTILGSRDNQDSDDQQYVRDSGRNVSGISAVRSLTTSEIENPMPGRSSALERDILRHRNKNPADCCKPGMFSFYYCASIGRNLTKCSDKETQPDDEHHPSRLSESTRMIILVILAVLFFLSIILAIHAIFLTNQHATTLKETRWT